MYIKSFQVGNYKSFVETVEVGLGRGLNIICGQNNSGKTALLEALAPNTSTNPHRSPKVIPAAGVQPDPASWTKFSVALSGEEIVQMIREQGQGGQYRVIAPNPTGAFAAQLRYVRNDVRSAERLIRWLFEQTELVFQLRRAFNSNPWQAVAAPSLDPTSLIRG